MERKVQELLAGKCGSYILPFFWQHGEDGETLHEYMRAVYDSNIREVCVESRPHPDFCGEKWWHDFDIIMEDAKKLGMRVWLLDDSHFPTGFANGAFKDADPELCKWYLNFNFADLVGPMPQANINVAKMTQSVQQRNPWGASRMTGAQTLYQDNELLAVTACRLGKGDCIYEQVDLTQYIQNNQIIWNVPDGVWRVYVSFATRNGGRADYMNIIDRDSVRVLIDTVYETHYTRYKDEFGKTFAGFFSDEPQLGNSFGYNFDETIGRKEMPLPWNKDVPRMLEERMGESWKQLLPLLWKPSVDSALNAKVRYDYMDTITLLIQDNFSLQIGMWCEEHGVEYIGHIVEDSDQHSRLGPSLGHFFRSMDGQHMAGMDDIGGEVMFGGENHVRIAGGVPREGEFYHFGQTKLAVSHAHIDPKKQGRAMCEIFGAYGWSLGVREMKSIADQFIVDGINRFVPHAFNPAPFPDPDCPPHFYAHGNNPQFKHFGKLMQYMQRMCHLIDGGTHIASVAMLYHGEAEWTGNYMREYIPARKLIEAQIDFDFIPSDIFDLSKYTLSNKLNINNESYSALVIPYAQFITPGVADFAVKAMSSGFPVLFLENVPDGLTDGSRFFDVGNNVVSIDELTTELRAFHAYEITTIPAFEHLRVYHYKQDEHIYIFANVATGTVFNGTVTVGATGEAYMYDPMENTLQALSFTPAKDGTTIELSLPPYGSAVVVFGKADTALAALPILTGKTTALADWSVSAIEAVSGNDFEFVYKADVLNSFAITHPDFSGIIRYESTFELKEADNIALRISDVYECADVWCNNVYCGSKICPPYLWNITEAVHTGENTIRIEVATNLDRKVRAMGGKNMFLPSSDAQAPTGIVGNVELISR